MQRDGEPDMEKLTGTFLQWLQWIYQKLVTKGMQQKVRPINKLKYLTNTTEALVQDITWDNVTLLVSVNFICSALYCKWTKPSLYLNIQITKLLFFECSTGKSAINP